MEQAWNSLKNTPYAIASSVLFTGAVKLGNYVCKSEKVQAAILYSLKIAQEAGKQIPPEFIKIFPYLVKYAPPMHLAMTALDIYRNYDYWSGNVSKLKNAALQGKPYEFGKYATKIGLDLTFPIIAKAISKMVNSAIKNGQAETCVNAFNKGLRLQRKVQANILSSRLLEKSFRVSNQFKNLLQQAKNLKMEINQFDAIVKKVCNNVGKTNKVANVVRNIAFKLYKANNHNIRPKGLPSSPKFDTPHIIGAEIKNGRIQGCHVDYKRGIQKSGKESGKLNFIKPKYESNGMCAGIMEFQGERKYTTWIQLDKNPEIFDNIMEFVKQTDFTKLSPNAINKYELIMPAKDGKVYIFVDALSAKINTVFFEHNDWILGEYIKIMKNLK